MKQPENGIPGRMKAAWRQHARRWRDNLYVYAVVSRRSRGVSIGLNLNPNKACNFRCIYCQVNRSLPETVRRVSLKKLADELNIILQTEKDGSLYKDPPFNLLSPAERGVRDIALSGDGEPTTFRRFEDAVRIAANARSLFKLDSAKIILLTNAAYLNNPAVCKALAVLDDNNGEIWAKLDAGTEEYFRKVNRAHVSLDRILRNILSAARIRPLTIQSLWSRIYDSVPESEEIMAYCERLNQLISAGGQLRAIQIHTLVRDPAEVHAAPLTRRELDQIASAVKSRVPIPIDVFYSE